MNLEKRYHVPRSQVWQGSRGRQAGHTHLHTREPLELGRIRRRAGAALCGRDGWYERPPEGEHELADVCPRCAEIADRARVVDDPTFAQPTRPAD